MTPPFAVMHFAAYAYVGESTAKPAKYYDNNVGGSAKLLEAVVAQPRPGMGDLLVERGKSRRPREPAAPVPGGPLCRSGVDAADGGCAAKPGQPLSGW